MTHPLPPKNCVAAFVKRLTALDRENSAYDKFRDFCEIAFCDYAKLTAPASAHDPHAREEVLVVHNFLPPPYSPFKVTLAFHVETREEHRGDLSMKRLGVLVCVVLLLSGCANQMPPLNFSVPNVGPSKHKINAELKALTVTLARPDETKGEMPAGIETITPMWKEALEEALNRMALFQDDASRKVSLSVKILAINLQPLGISFTTTVSARYELLDRATGAIIYSEQVDSSGTTPMDYAFLGVIRQRESINRAVQNNISKFLMAVETVQVNKPLFPGRKEGKQ
jgi:PBP1b-binding outer membrane lipoprotein LpoB